jgi:hypothetical protein
MIRTITLFLLLALLTLPACASTPSPAKPVGTFPFSFPVKGRTASISIADLVSVVALVPERPIYEIRVISHNRIEVQTSPSPSVLEFSTVLRRIRGHWKPDGELIGFRDCRTLP